MNDALLKPGTKCFAKRDIVEPPGEDWPGGVYASRGEVLEIVRACDPPHHSFRYVIKDPRGHEYYVRWAEVTVVKPEERKNNDDYSGHAY